MFTLTGSGMRNILFDARLRNPAQLPAQFASRKAHNFYFFLHPVRRPVVLCLHPVIQTRFLTNQRAHAFLGLFSKTVY